MQVSQVRHWLFWLLVATAHCLQAVFADINIDKSRSVYYVELGGHLYATNWHRHCHFCDPGRRSPCGGSASLPLTSTALGGVNLCQPIEAVLKLFPQARDTRISSEGTDWPAKSVDLGDDTWVLFESSWVDANHVSRITTNSPKYVTPHGYRVGTSIAELLTNGEKLQFDYPEGYLSITITSEQVGFFVEDEAAAKFWAQFKHKGDPLQVLDHAARIKQLVIVGDCDRKKR